MIGGIPIVNAHFVGGVPSRIDNPLWLVAAVFIGSQVAKIQSQMKSFVKGMVRGRPMNVLSVPPLWGADVCRNVTCAPV